MQASRCSPLVVQTLAATRKVQRTERSLGLPPRIEGGVRQITEGSVTSTDRRLPHRPSTSAMQPACRVSPMRASWAAHASLVQVVMPIVPDGPCAANLSL